MTKIPSRKNGLILRTGYAFTLKSIPVFARLLRSILKRNSYSILALDASQKRSILSLKTTV